MILLILFKGEKMDIKINIVENEARISAPYDKDFLNEMRYHNCRRNSETKEWIVDIDLLDIIRNKIKDIYDIDDFATNDFIDVWVTIPDYEHLEETEHPIKMFGKIIAKSTRKGGASWGKDIVNLSSSCNGHIMHKIIWISPGKFKMKNVSKARVLSEKASYEEAGFIFEIVEHSKINKQILIEERARLMKQMNEIDKMIQQDR